MRSDYRDRIVGELMQSPGRKNPMQVPRLVKITLNMGLGEATHDKNALAAATKELALIAGQQPVPTRARKSIAGFNIRSGWPIGCKVTLRRGRMYDFFERLINVAMPRIRDFRGVSLRSFDGRGNFSIGIREQIVFPEIDYDKIDRVRGLDIAITTSAATDADAKELLAAFNFPFKD